MAFLLNEDGSFLLNEDGTKIVIDEGEELADPIDLITANPDSANPNAFATEADLYVSQVKASIPQMNTAFTALRLLSVTDVSNTSNEISRGMKIFTVSADKSFLPGQYLTIADAAEPANCIILQITSYMGTTLIGESVRVLGSGTKTNWVISLSAPPVLPLESLGIFHAHTGVGHGSTNTKIRRLSTVVSNTSQGIDWNYLDSSTLGGSITILISGVYSLSYVDHCTDMFGISKNSSQLTTAFSSITETDKLLAISRNGVTAADSSSIVTYLHTGSVLRVQTAGTATDTAGMARLRLERLF